ncbi:hypothetical protein Ndes2526B_g01526 [Nannochloris sp. 'desiccata']
MVLNVRQKQADAIVRMLHFNTNAPSGLGGRQEDESFKILILDRYTQNILAPLLHVNELRRHGVTLHMLLDSDRQAIPDVPAVYFVQPTETAIDRIASDAARGLYDTFYINFSTHVPRPLMERLASSVATSGAAARIARVYDQHSQFASLEQGLFTLGLPSTYLQLNDPGAQDTGIEAAVGSVVEGLFCALATLGVVPIIRCPPGGAAEHVAAKLDARLRDALRDRVNLFSEGAAGSGLAASLQRPLLCLFDRNFELSVALQHTWTYKPLVQDVLRMKLNRISIASDSNLNPGGPNASNQQKSYEVDDADFFWHSHGREQFPKIAEQVEAELAKYKSAIEDLNRATGANVDPTADPAESMSANTRGLMSAVSSLPELTEKKRVIDKHTNMATSMLKLIKERALDHFYSLEEELVSGKADGDAVLELLQGHSGTGADKLRLALVWLLTAPTVPTELECQAAEDALIAAGADMAAWAYVKRMRRLNLTGKGQQGGGGGAGGGAAYDAQLTTLLGSTFGQGLSSLTKGVKNLLAGEQQAAVTVAVEALMDGKPNPDTDGYRTFDPKGPGGRAQRPAGPFKEAIVFMIGGGNYLEWESLVCWAQRAQPTPKYVVYGATELLSGEEFISQLAELGRRSNAA